MKILFQALLVAIAGLLALPAGAQLTVTTIPTTGLIDPSGLAEDASGNFYLADSANNRIVRMDGTSRAETTLAGTGTAGATDGSVLSATFNNPQGILLASTNGLNAQGLYLSGTNGLLVADYNNNAIRFVRLSDGFVTTLAGQTNAGSPINATGTNATFRYPCSLAQDTNGNVYIADWGNDAIRVMNLNDPALGVTNLILTGATLHRPSAVAMVGNQLWVADAGPTSSSDNTIRLFTLSTPTTGTLTTFIGGNSVHVQPGFQNSPAGGTNVLFNKPLGLLWVSGTGLLICDSGNNCIRLAALNTTYGPTNYAVTTLAGVPQTPGTADGLATVATFTSPNSLIVDSSQNIFITDSGGVSNPLRTIEQNGSADFLPVPTPVVGYVIIVIDPYTGDAVAEFESDLPKTFYNDPVIAISDDSGVTVHFTYGPTENAFLDPTQTTNYESVEAYDTSDSNPSDVPASIMASETPTPDLTIKAIGVTTYTSTRPESSVAYGYFHFQTATPLNNSADPTDPMHIKLSSITANAAIYYTLDGSNPTNTSALLNTNNEYFAIPRQCFNPTTGLATLNAYAVRTGYHDSGVFSATFNISNAVYDVTLTPNSGYYPMGQTITVTCPGTNVFYTQDGSEPTSNSIPVSGIVGGIGSIHWMNPTNDLSYLRVKAIITTPLAQLSASGQMVPSATIGTPPDFNPQLSAGIGSTVIVPVVCNLTTNQQVQSFQFRTEIAPVNNTNTPSIWPLSISPANDFIPLVTAAQGGTTASNSVVAYSLGITNGLSMYAVGTGTHILFHSYAVIALLAVQIPYAANVGDTYALNVLYPSATADAYNSAVPLTAMPPITILVTNLPYVVGDSASANGSWYNAGTFGDGNLDNSDVNQAFYAASGLRVPYSFTDVFNAMDAYPPDTAGSPGGDGNIRFLDWYTILQRSLRFDYNNWSREWSEGGDLIDFTTNLVVPQALVAKAAAQTATPATPSWPWYRQVLLGAESVSDASPNATVYVPIYAQLADGSSLSGLQFRALITPEGDAPALTTAPQLEMAAGVATPLLTQSFNPGETAFGWSLGSFNYLSRSSNFLGWLSFTIPTNAATGQSYLVSLLNADGSPNATNQYDFETRSATVTVNAAAPSVSICSDEWKIHFFGSTTNPAAADNADPDGDGVPNWMEFLAGTDPTNALSRLQITGTGVQTVKGQRQVGFQWLTAPGHAYEVQWTTNMIRGGWTTLTTVSGTGATTNCPDPSAGNATRFYRLHVLP